LLCLYFKCSVISRFTLDTLIICIIYIVGKTRCYKSRINFWMDNWLGTPLVSIFNIQYSRDLDNTLSDFIVDGKPQLPGCFLMNPLVAASVQNIVLAVPPLLDRRIWPFSTNGKLIANSIFLFLHCQRPFLVWPSIIWRPCIHPSHSLIFWRLMHGKLPTDENLQCRGCTLVSICVLCYASAKTYGHLFMECDFAMHLWHWLEARLNCVFDVSFAGVLLDCIHASCSSQVKDAFSAAIIHIVHVIWKARNTLRFSANRLSLHATKSSIISLVALSGNMSYGHCLRSDKMLLDNFLVSPTYRRYKEIIAVTWKAPTIGWVKANTDGFVKYNLASCGGIFLDDRGTFLGAFASNLGDVSTSEAELIGILIAMVYAASHSWYSLWIECDFTSAVQAFMNADIIPFRLRNRWHNCFQRGTRTLCSHLYRERNCCADKLADFGHSIMGIVWLDSLPQSLSADFFCDLSFLSF